MNPPILEVIAHDDGQVTYRVRPSSLSPIHYGVIMATQVKYIADMLAAETPKLDAEIVLHEIMRHMLAAIDEKDEMQEALRMMQ